MSMHLDYPRILIIAGSDSGGGAGMQADIKSVTRHDGFAMSAITAVTVQNTIGVHDIHPIPTAIIHGQISCVLSDIGADIIKIGMLGSADIIHTVSTCLRAHAPDIPTIIDPVMQAKGGAPLINTDADIALRTQLLPLATLITPNIPEAETLSGVVITDMDSMQHAAQQLAQQLPGVSVLIKGGHMDEDMLTSLLHEADGTLHYFTNTRIDTRHTHGTGCTLAATIATLLGKGHSLTASIAQAHDYVHNAIRNAPGYGAGHGPLKH